MSERDSDESAVATASTIPPPPGEPDALAPGTTLGRYVILKRLGRGGMGIVYLAFDNELERRIAIKVLRPEASAGGSIGEARLRLLREAQAMAKVSHPNVVAVFDVGTFGDEVFLAMEYVNGDTLRQWRKAGARTLREIVLAYLQAGRGLEAAHTEGILHRDFKPENVLVDERDRVRVLDFGLARLAGAEAAPSNLDSVAKIAFGDTGVQHRDGLATPLTHVGEVLGTPAYMAPEQLRGEGITAKSDQFSFCLALYEALYGALPFGGETVAQRARAMIEGRLEPAPKDARVPSGVRRVLVRGLAGSADQRFESMGALLAALERSIAVPKRWLAAIVVIAVAGLSAGIALLRPPADPPCRGAAEAIAPVWSAARADDLSRAFKASGNPRAEEALAHTRPVLDRYAASWMAMHTEACEATRVRGTQSGEGLDLRMACLQQRSKELEATVRLFLRADARMVDDAVLAAARLAPVEACVDIAALRASFAPPKDEAQRREIEDQRRKLADVSSLYHTARYAEAYPAASALVEATARTGYPPTHAEALLWKGRIEFGLDKPGASDTLFDAALEAEAARDDALKAEAWIHAFQMTTDRRQRDDAARYGRLADAAVRRVRDNDALRGDLLHAQVYSANQRGEPAEALRLAKEELALRQRTTSPADEDIILARTDVADALWGQGALDEALPIQREVQRASAALLGETHPDTLRSLSDIGIGLTERGDYAEAIRTLEPMRTASIARKPTVIAIGRVALAAALVGSGRVAEGLDLFEAAEAIVKAHDSEEATGADAGEMSRILVEREVNREAEIYAARALAIFDKIDAPEEQRGEVFGVRALCRARRGDATGAIADADRALAVKAKPQGARAELIPLLARGEALLSSGRAAEALGDLERAVEVADSTKGDLAVRAEVRFAVARALVASGGDRGRAAVLATRAANELERAGLPEAAARARGWSAR